MKSSKVFEGKQRELVLRKIENLLVSRSASVELVMMLFHYIRKTLKRWLDNPGPIFAHEVEAVIRTLRMMSFSEEQMEDLLQIWTDKEKEDTEKEGGKSGKE